ncbi:response regulator transcription factor [Chitinophaga sancti]|uniref:response regulator n=1 Tax=Chitinophaga sancti TaxID=1004 RepID=UPI002A75FA4F|nr:response regulator transcription factor [Chitinophaga sancti]WPQ61383.1 response regulator transcription factor [Chitinophaga sancti]
MKTILIALDPSIFTYGLKQIIATMAQPTRIETADTLDAALTLLDSRCVDLFITDLHPEVLGAVKAKCPEIRVMVYTAADERTFAIDNLLAGADGYLSKSAKKEEMEYAVKTVLNGEKYMSATVRQEMLDQLWKKRRAGHKGVY